MTTGWRRSGWTLADVGDPKRCSTDPFDTFQARRLEDYTPHRLEACTRQPRFAGECDRSSPAGSCSLHRGITCDPRKCNSGADCDGHKSPLNKREEQFAGLTCPDCSGPLMSSQDGEFLEFRCITGHAYSPEAMRAAHLEGVEQALWSAVASLREHSDCAGWRPGVVMARRSSARLQ